MPGKSQRGRRKYSIQGKKKKGGLSRPTVLTQQPALVQTAEPVSGPNKSASSASMPIPTPKVAVVQYPHVATELRTIGILAGVILAILAILALVLS